MEFSDEEIKKAQALTSHVFWGLRNENLIADFFQFGSPELLKKNFAGATSEGIICEPSTPGVEFFLWGFGQMDMPNEYIFDPAFSPVIEGVPNMIPDVKATKI